MNLRYVSYMSVQTQVMSKTEVENFLFKIREKNKRLAITGVLLLIQGKFVQYIEGPEEEIDRVYKKIKHDPRHNDLLLLDNGYLENRQFTNWSMAYKEVEDNHIKSIVGRKDLNLDDVFLNPTEDKTHPVLKILYNFTKTLSS